MNKYLQKSLREVLKLRVLRNTLISSYNYFHSNPEVSKNLKSNFENLSEEKTIEELNKDALSSTFLINEEALESILNDCKNQLAYPHLKYDGTVIKNAEGQLIDYNQPIAFKKDCIWFTYKNIDQWESIKNVTYDPKVIEIAKQYLGNNPIVRNQYIWWSFEAKNEISEDYDSPRYWFHYDIDDFKFLKIFIYLNDVDANTGPHLVVKSTHRSKPWKYKLNRRVNSLKSKDFFSDKEIVELTGPKGTCFFEDTFTYHNGTPPQKPRLVLQIEYSLTNFKLG